jgi:hypothetical protein
MKLDNGVITAIDWYVVAGLHPGSFGMAIIRGDYQDACRSAHSNLLDHVRNGEDVVANMLQWADDTLPKSMREDPEAWIAHKGIQHAPASVQVEWLLGPGIQFFDKFNSAKK